MICIEFVGRLGNQMFTYAFARSLIEQSGVKENYQIVANFKRCKAGGDAVDGFDDSLQYFKVLNYEDNSSYLALKYGNFIQRLLYILYIGCTHISFINKNDTVMSMIEKRIERFGFFFTGAADKARTIPKHLPDNIFIKGYFADKNNFDSIRPILLQEFTPRHVPLPQNTELYQLVAQKNSVCVSIRRGDYLSNAYKKDFFLCDEEYFNKAIKIIYEKVENPVFIFFSDDIEWVKEHFHSTYYSYYYESGKDPVWEKLRLMYSCHHFIISNSTFAWWAQYLGCREGKIVISPSRWFANPNWHSNLIDESFIKIDTN